MSVSPIRCHARCACSMAASSRTRRTRCSKWSTGALVRTMATRDAGLDVDAPDPVELDDGHNRLARSVARSGPPRSRLRATDLMRVGTVGMRTRRLRTVLTAVGIAIGIAALVAVLGISASSRADLNAKLD